MATSEYGNGPHVLIAGAGLGGLILAIVLEKAKISYDIFERTAEIRPLGKEKLLASLIHLQFYHNLSITGERLYNAFVSSFFFFTSVTGAAIILGVNVMPFFRQIGIYDEFVSLAKEVQSIDNYNEERELLFTMNFKPTHIM